MLLLVQLALVLVLVPLLVLMMMVMMMIQFAWVDSMMEAFFLSTARKFLVSKLGQ